MNTHRAAWAALFSLLFPLLVASSGCKEATLGPDPSGRIEGAVFDFDTRAALGGVGITSSPPSSAILTGGDGTFVLEDVAAGNYTITASRSGYQTNSVTVSVREGRTTQAAVFLEKADTTANQAALSAEVLNWSNQKTEGDTVRVRVEYRVRNTGAVDLPAYEVYFRIETEEVNFFQEQNGTDLNVGQEDIRQFSKKLLKQPATAVTVDDFSFEEPS